MRIRFFSLVLALASLAAGGPARADEQPVALKDAPGRDAVEQNCGACHSLDYIGTNSPFPNATLWEAEVQKMIKVFGAPIEDADAKTITDYLAKNYGS
jgi:sulfite dehydrogenase (cytochrome) subunit B